MIPKNNLFSLKNWLIQKCSYFDYFYDAMSIFFALLCRSFCITMSVFFCITMSVFFALQCRSFLQDPSLFYRLRICGTKFCFSRCHSSCSGKAWSHFLNATSPHASHDKECKFKPTPHSAFKNHYYLSVIYLLVINIKHLLGVNIKYF